MTKLKLVLLGWVLVFASHWTPMSWALPVYLVAWACFGSLIFGRDVETKEKP